MCGIIICIVYFLHSKNYIDFNILESKCVNTKKKKLQISLYKTPFFFVNCYSYFTRIECLDIRYQIN